MQVKKLSLDFFIDRLKNGDPVTLARYGDGEVRTILQGKYSGQKNSNGCTFSPYLGSLLRSTVRHQNDYFYGILRIALSQHRAEFSRWLAREGIEIPWVNGDFLLTAALAGDLFPFIEIVRDRGALMIGPYHLSQLWQEGFFKPLYHLVPPAKNAIERRNQIIRQVKDALKKYDPGLILWSCGLHSKVFIEDVFRYTKGTVDQIDCGSMWDGFCFQGDGRRVQSRSYIRNGRVDWAALIEVNTGKREKGNDESFRISDSAN